MKRILSILFLSLLVALFSASCSINTGGPTPYGIWHNSAMGLTLDINPNSPSGEPFWGEYWHNGEKQQVYLLTNVNDGFSIHSIEAYDKERNLYTPRYQLFMGYFKIKDGKMYYKLNSNYQEETGIVDTIVFEKIEEYEID